MTAIAEHRPNDKIRHRSDNAHTRQAERIANMAVSLSLTTGDQLSGLLLNVVFISHGSTDTFSLHVRSQAHELTDKLATLLPDEGERGQRLTGDVIEEILRLWYARIYNGNGVQP